MTLSRIGVLLYGTLIYLFFLATYVYCIGFVTELIVPKHINSAGEGSSSLTRTLIIDAGFLSLFAVQHTIMARTWFKHWLTRFIPRAAERSTFVLATCLILCGMFLFWEPIPNVIWEVSSSPLRTALNVISVGGFVGVVYVTFIIDHFDLFGLKPVIYNFIGSQEEAVPFQVKSLYRFSRHPMYFFLLFAFWSAPTMTAGRLLFAALCTGYILVGVRFEEYSLEKEHGDDYRRYQEALPMIIPNLGSPLDSSSDSRSSGTNP